MSTASTQPPAATPSAPAVPEAAPQTRRAGLIEVLPLRVLGALLLLGALDPARWPNYLSPQWFFGVAAFCAGFWAGAPVVERPVMESHRLAHQILRHRNTLLAAVSALLAAFQSPPVWLMAVEVLLLLTYLTIVDSAAAPARPAGQQLGQAVCGYGASAFVLLAALAPITGGWWGRIVAGVAVLGTLGLLFSALWLRRPAGYPRRSAAESATATGGSAARHR